MAESTDACVARLTRMARVALPDFTNLHVSFDHTPGHLPWCALVWDQETEDKSMLLFECHSVRCLEALEAALTMLQPRLTDVNLCTMPIDIGGMFDLLCNNTVELQPFREFVEMREVVAEEHERTRILDAIERALNAPTGNNCRRRHMNVATAIEQLRRGEAVSIPEGKDDESGSDIALQKLSRVRGWCDGGLAVGDVKTERLVKSLLRAIGEPLDEDALKGGAL